MTSIDLTAITSQEFEELARDAQFMNFEIISEKKL